MTGPLESSLFFPFLLYAETHYRFSYFFSFLKKPEPELIADVPHRLEPGRLLPVLIVAKDAHRYPATLRQVTVEVDQGGTRVLQKTLLDSPCPLDSPLWWNVFSLEIAGHHGWLDCRVAMTIEQNGRTRTYESDNHRTSSHAPLRVFVSQHPLPRLPHLHLGDAHTHTQYTDDQVEFGSPIAASVEMCRAMGQTFFCATDHSYDLDDLVGDYLRPDPSLAKWRLFQEEVETTNKSNRDFAVIPGEEVSCRNLNDQNVHLLLYGNRAFFHGSGDSAERWLRTRSENSVRDVLTNKEDEALAFAAHAKEPVPWVQGALLGRGEWGDEDLADGRLSGIQFANGRHDEGFAAGFDSWKRLLLNGRRSFLIAGNDAHGNFSRFRQIGVPFVRIKEDGSQLFGKMRTGVFSEEPFSERSWRKAVGSGRSIITDGPVMNFLSRESHNATSIGSELRGNRFQIETVAASSPEFGELERLRIFQGVVGEQQEETVVAEDRHSGLLLQKKWTIEIRQRSYIRGEIYTSKDNLLDGKSHFCFTNPIWLAP